eukprot:s406_g9.t1
MVDLLVCILVLAINSLGEAVSSLPTGATNDVDLDGTCFISKKNYNQSSLSQPEPGFPDDVDTDYMKQWRKVWVDQWVNNGLGSIITMLMKQAVGGLVGDVIQTLLKIFFPSKWASEFDVLKYLTDWTKRYVEVEMIEQVNEEVKNFLEIATQDHLEEYHYCIGEVKKIAESWIRVKFPTEQLHRCVEKLDLAMDKALTAEGRILNSRYKYAMIPSFLTAATIAMRLQAK